MNELALYSLHLFCGGGGGVLADALLGHLPVGAVELDEYCREVLLARQRDGILPPFPIWDDVCTFRTDNPDTAEYIGELQKIKDRLIIAGGFPCQDLSSAGRGAGIEGKQSGLWKEMARIVGEIRPRFVFVENAPTLLGRGLGRVLGDLAGMGYDARWGIVSAADSIWTFGPPSVDHLRYRAWILAFPHSYGE